MEFLVYQSNISRNDIFFLWKIPLEEDNGLIKAIKGEGIRSFCTNHREESHQCTKPSASLSPPSLQHEGPHSGLLSLLGSVFPQLGGWSCHLLSCKEMASPRLHAMPEGSQCRAPSAPSQGPSVALRSASPVRNPLSLF